MTKNNTDINVQLTLELNDAVTKKDLIRFSNKWASITILERLRYLYPTDGNRIYIMHTAAQHGALEILNYIINFREGNNEAQRAYNWALSRVISEPKTLSYNIGQRQFAGQFTVLEWMLYARTMSASDAKIEPNHMKMAYLLQCVGGVEIWTEVAKFYMESLIPSLQKQNMLPSFADFTRSLGSPASTAPVELPHKRQKTANFVESVAEACVRTGASDLLRNMPRGEVPYVASSMPKTQTGQQLPSVDDITAPMPTIRRMLPLSQVAGIAATQREKCTNGRQLQRS